MDKRQAKSLLNRIVKDYKKGIKIGDLEEKYNIKFDLIEDYFYWIIREKYQGKIEGMKAKEYKIQEEMYFLIMEDMSRAWVESKIYNYLEHDFEYVTVWEQ